MAWSSLACLAFLGSAAFSGFPSIPGMLPGYPCLLNVQYLSCPLNVNSLFSTHCSNSHGPLHVWFSSVAQSSPTLCDPMSCSMPGLPVHHQLPESTQPLSIESVMPSNHLYIHRCKRLWGTYQWQQFKAKKLGRSDESGIIAAKVGICAVRRPHSSSKPLTHCTYIYIRQPTCGHQPC